jgi:Icc-related predicted phosphoesterase
MNCFFVSDLHGRIEKYEKLFKEILIETPEVVFLGGDLLPHSFIYKNFIEKYLVKNLQEIKSTLHKKYPNIFLILGNDDARYEEVDIIKYSELGYWNYINQKKIILNNYAIFGYGYTPPSPFILKDWEKYDVSRFTEPGCISPEEGKRTVEIPDQEKKFGTIKNDIDKLIGDNDLTNSIFMFHGPPYKTNLDIAAIAGKIIDHIPVDPHVGSIAIKRFIETKQPMLTLHGHIHESSRISGSWKDKIGNTFCFSAANEGPELSLIKFDTEKLDRAERFLI